MTTTLTPTQVEVLRWVADGTPDGVYTTGFTHRISARALERRGLVTVSGHGDTWTATATPEGRAWLDTPPVTPEAEADTLLRRVIEAGGTLKIEESRGEQESNDRLVRLSIKSELRPEGKRLATRRTGQWGSGPREFYFEDHFVDEVAASPVPVPERVTRYHPAVKAFTTDRDWQLVTSDHVARAARILQAIAVEAERRGFTVSSRSPDGRGTRDLAHLLIDTGGAAYSIQVREIAGPGGAQRQPTWGGGRRGPAWIEHRGWDFVSTGRLELTLHGPATAYDGDKFRDARSHTVESLLPGVFQRIEVRRLETAAAERKREDARLERHRRWEAAMETARQDFHKSREWDHFKARSNDWQAIERHRDFLAAARGALDSASDKDRTVLTQYLDRMAVVVDDLDPILHPELLRPGIADPSAEDLKPFLGGWSPYGPEGRGW